MKTIKAEPVHSTSIVNSVRVAGYATNLEGRDDYPHFIPFTEIKGDTMISKAKHYVDMISKNHPEYDFIPEHEEIKIMTPKVEQAVHPKMEEMKKAFGVDEVEFNTNEDYKSELEYQEKLEEQSVPDNVDQDTGEIHETSPHNNEPLKEKTMENQREAPKAPRPKVSLGRKLKWYGACGLGIGVRSITLPTHATLQTASDLLHLAAVGVRNVEASAISGLKLSSATKDEIKGRIDQRTAKIQGVLMMPVTIPIGIVQSIKQAAKSPIVEAQTA